MSRPVFLGLLLLAVVATGYLYLRPGGLERVQDTAVLMSPDQQKQLDTYHRYLLLDHDIDYRVITARNTGDINRYALRAFEKSGTGSASDTGRGLLLVIDPEQNQLRVEVSQSLEGVFPDAFVAYLEQRQMIPFFAAGRVADGILATTEMIIIRAQNTQANAGFESEAWAAFADGGGATADARLGSGRDDTFRHGADVRAGETPEETLNAYFAAQSARNGSPELDIYTPETRTFMADWVVTAAQMDNQVKTFRNCHAEPAHISTDGQYAVIRYPLEERKCSPFFLARGEDGRWRLDLATMSHAIRFGRTNAWRFYSRRNPYRFAFEDWAFDNSGIPRKVRWGVSFTTVPGGVRVDRVDIGSPAEQFGLHANDYLLTWNSEPIQDHRHLSRLLSRIDPGEKVTIHLERAGEKMVLSGKAPPRPE